MTEQSALDKRFEELQTGLDRNRLTVTHRSRLERITALYRHVANLTHQRDQADDYWPRNERTALDRRLEAFKSPTFFLSALEALVVEICTNKETR